MDTETNQKSKTPYIKPLMEKIELVPEEAVLATCKYNHGAQSDPIMNCAPDLACIFTARS